jgi:hypothetical protein
MQRPPKKVSLAQRENVDGFWRGLSADDREALRPGACRPPARVFVRFVEPDDDEVSAIDDFYEYLINHEIFLEDATPLHICSAHREARRVLSRGHVPHDFQCPRADLACPMRALLATSPGRDAKLRLVTGGPR